MLAGGWISNTPIQRFLDVGVGGTKRARGLGIERDVEMDACLFEIAGLQVSGIDGFEEYGEIFKTFERAIGSTRDARRAGRALANGGCDESTLVPAAALPAFAR